MFSKKGEKPNPESPVGLLVLVIGILMVVYVIFIPECDKCDLLGEECPSYCEDSSSTEIFLSESIGDVSDFPNNDKTYDFGTLNLFIRNEPEIKSLGNELSSYNGLFGDLDHDLSFSLKDLDNVDTASLVLSVADSRGNLIVELNENKIFDGKINGGSVKTIDVPISYLKENNRVKLVVSSPGILFWLRNFYDFNEVKFKTVYELIQAKQEKTFRVSSLEKNNLEDVELSYSPFCRDYDSNPLKIYLNGNLISSSVVSCRTETERIDIYEGDIKKGKNELSFIVEGGDYALDDVELNLELSRSIYPEYSFDIDDFSDFSDYFIELDMDEINGERKVAELIINGRSLFMDTESNRFKEDITSYLDEGENEIRIEPSTEFIIDNLEIWGE